MGNSNDAFDFDAQQLKPGKLVPLKLNMLPGAPVAWMEHLGDDNVGYWNDMIARANTLPAELGGAVQTVERRRENRVRNRDVLAKHSVRRLDAKRKDGTPATVADIPAFCKAVPDDVADMMFRFAQDADNWRDHAVAAAEAIAEK